MTEKFRENQEIPLVFDNAANTNFVRGQIYCKYNKSPCQYDSIEKNSFKSSTIV